MARSKKDNPYDKTNAEPKKKIGFVVQWFHSKNVVYAKTVSKADKNIYVYDRKILGTADDAGNYVYDKNIVPLRRISKAKFRSEVILIQRNNVIKMLKNQYSLSHKDALKLYEKNKQDIKAQRIEGIMAQLSMNRNNANLYYNDLVDKKKFTELRKYANSPNLEVSYRF